MDWQQHDTHADDFKRKVFVHRPGDYIPPLAASLPAVIAPAGWHWRDLTDWRTGKI